jgi:lysophospholipase L1-like esterase
MLGGLRSSIRISETAAILFMLLRPEVLKPFVGYLLALLALLTLIDRAAQMSIQGSVLLTEPTEINSPAIVFAKVDALRNFQGIRIAVLGDSLVYGRSLQEHGIEPWRKNNLTAAITDELHLKWPDRGIMVMNFGMNGITPSELETLVPLVMSANPDLIIMDLTLRSFSRDFNDPGASSRNWLKTMAIDPRSGSLSFNETATLIESTITAFMIEHYFLYSIREIVQFRLFEARPKEFLAGVRNKANGMLRDVRYSSTTPDELMLQLRAQQRYAKVDLGDDNSQWVAYQRLLREMKEAKQKALVFYATENPDIRESLMDESQYHSMINKISKVTQMDNHNLFIGPLAELAPENYLDHVHLTPSGYRILAKQLADRTVTLLQVK